MTNMRVILGLLAVVFMTPTAAQADEALEKIVKARQAFMQIYSFNLGQLGAMAKGEAEYDAKLASASAMNLLAAAKMDNSAMWPAGSGNDNGALKGKTRALPEIWSTYPKVAEKSTDLKTALEALVKVAGTDLDGLKGAIGPVGKGCGGCHEDFRAEKF